MTIAEVYLFKTPLDSDYNNVIDTVNYNGDKKMLIFETMQRSYEYISFQAFSRSVKRVGNSTLLTLPIIYEEGRQYNYLVIEDDLQEYYFYFINSVISENDNTSKPSSTFDLQWDCWNNNINDFISIPNAIDYRHHKRFEIEYNPNNTIKGIKPIYKVMNFPLNLNTRIENINKTRYIPAFFVVTIKGGELMTLPDKSLPIDRDDGLYINFPFTFNGTIAGNIPYAGKLRICDSVNNRFNNNVIYMLAGVFDTVTEKFVTEGVKVNGAKFNFKTSSNDTLEYASDYLNEYGNVKLPILKIPKNLQPYVNTVHLSFNSPFRYYTSESQTLTVINFVDNPLVMWEYSTGDETIPYIVIGDCIFKNDTYEIDKRFISSFEQSFDINFDDDIGINHFLTDKNMVRNDDSNIDPILYTPSIKTLKLCYNSKYLTIFPYNNDIHTITIGVKNDTLQPHFKIADFDGKVSQNIFVENSGFFSFGVDSLENYLLKNGGTTNLTVLSNALNIVPNTIKAVLSFKGGMINSGISSLQQVQGNFENIIGAAISVAQADRMPNEWSTNSGECDMVYQDRIRIVREYVDINNPVLTEFIKGVYNFGYNYPCIESPFDNTRISFDYVKTVDCDLSSLKISKEDRMELENAFNRGITKWHIYDSDGGVIFSSNMIKDKATVTNLEIFTDSDEEFKQWLNS